MGSVAAARVASRAGRRTWSCMFGSPGGCSCLGLLLGGERVAGLVLGASVVLLEMLGLLDVGLCT